ncbi:hypothetical protein [Phycisphaera mikurensis]|uniref:Uncharacterized protein n=1 Tax=Phycisphaera mikurensis (strain NBRC 102666 / KCTC 22515 / FYK2301M01) TaxID=1142394 RepID=I0IA94_PHYMF|nr:hypothetical protein [Phycisphaera mikurensis]MBB6441817.1 hypothetical protein [Phycisphaera mikurensis]BAM02182.1 hypothetical protein PSMK_00230 [Phycisphaera mikurensis NBRC 102666]
MASARPNKKKSASAAKQEAPPKPGRKPAGAPKAKAKSKAAATAKRQKPTADPRVAELKKQLRAVAKQLDGGLLDLVSKVALQKEKRDLERRIADLTGDKPFLTKVPRHKRAA